MGTFVDLIRAFLEVIDRVADLNKPGWRVLSLIVSPIVALVACYFSVRQRTELKEQAKDLGVLEERVNASQERLAVKESLLETKDAELKQQVAEISSLQRDISLLTERSHELWKIRPAAPFPELLTWQREPRAARIVAFGNLKGGVGKTTLASNFGAYAIRELKLRTLFVDLDFQASLSNLLIQACAGSEIADQDFESGIDRLFDDRPEFVVIQSVIRLLDPKLTRGWLIPTSYQFAQFENQLLMHQLLLEQRGLDVRYRLAHSLLRPEVSLNYDLIIVDLPPRMSLGAINALIASHYFVVPTILDKLSSEAVGQFLSHMRAVKDELELDLELAGIVGTMSLREELGSSERRIWDNLESAGHVWRSGTDFRITSTIRRAAAISKAAGEELAYLSGGSDGGTAREILQPVFQEIAKRIGLVSR